MWGEWIFVGNCTVSCGNGTRLKIRSCNDPAVRDECDIPCEGSNGNNDQATFEPCNTQPCTGM